ncbi:hypothetical protein V6N13_072438 [Hibiscus sabdariffa]
MDALAMDHDSTPAGESLKPTASYKDGVMGGSDSHPGEDLIPIEDDDIELLDEDVRLKAKAQFVPRKSSSLILKPRDPNVMPKKSASGFASTSGTSRKSSLNPSKHIVLSARTLASPCSLVYFNKRPMGSFGDFNATLSPADRLGCISGSPERSFQDMVSDYGLHDLGYSGPNFTWSRGNCSIRLDRCFGNAHWFERFPRSFLHHLLRMKSDHRPICLSTDDQVPATRSYAFKYLADWSLHSDFNRFVRDNWLSTQPIPEAILFFSEADSKWNDEVFGSIG